jgi:glycerol-3-phosphate dehydrogenase (NAD(P)+)
MGEHVTIVGTGAMGTVCALLLDHNGVACTLCGAVEQHVDAMIQTRRNDAYLPGHVIPDSITITRDARAALAGATLIVSAIPCQFIRSVWERLASDAPRTVPIVSVAKGIEVGTLLTPTQVLCDVLGPVPVVSLSGPSIAPELAKRLPASVVAASEDESLAVRTQKLFRTEWFRIYTNTDLLGVELAGASKNVIALAAGILDGMGAGDNAKAAMATRGMVEISRLGAAMGARADTFQGLAGVGDLIVTCISPRSRNRTAGERIGKGMSTEEVIASTPSVIEGIPTTRSVVELARRHGVEMPITQAVYRVLFEGLDPIQAVTQLMTRESKAE